MKDGQWKDWTEPLGILFAEAKEFLEQIDFSDFPKGGKLIEGRPLYTRKEELAKAFVAYMENVLIGDFLADYVYTTSVFSDTLSFVFEYIGENEHQFDLHGDEFAQTKEELLEDFTLYVGNWLSPYWRNLE